MKLTTRILVPTACAIVAAVGGGELVSAHVWSASWMRVAADSHYVIYVDTSRLNERYGSWPLVWYRTDHAIPRLHKGKEFDREIVQSAIRCDSLWFKVAKVDMSTGAGKPVARQQTTLKDLYKQPWRPVERGTIEESVARAACGLTRERHPEGASAKRSRPKDR